MVMSAEMKAHLASGQTTLARCWSIRRQDGVTLGFTDHDRDLTFDGIRFRADTGMTAYALQQSTGLSVDNTQAFGALSDAAITDADIDAGRFDGAEVAAWLVNWADLSQRILQFRGSIGEIRRSGGAFQAELRGLTEALNTPLGRIYQKPCTAVLGDRACGFDLNTSGYAIELEIDALDAEGRFVWPELAGFAPDWFSRGRLNVLSGSAEGLWGAIKTDRSTGAGREIVLWSPLRAPVQPGDRVLLQAGCDKRAETCRLKFQNFLNFQGFPDIPGEDWMIAYPRSGNPNTGGSRR